MTDKLKKQDMLGTMVLVFFLGAFYSIYWYVKKRKILNSVDIKLNNILLYLFAGVFVFNIFLSFYIYFTEPIDIHILYFEVSIVVILSILSSFLSILLAFDYKGAIEEYFYKKGKIIAISNTWTIFLSIFFFNVVLFQRKINCELDKESKDSKKDVNIKPEIPFFWER